VSRELSEVVQEHADTLRRHFNPDTQLDGDTGTLVYLYHTKMDYKLVHLLEDTGLGTFRRRDGRREGEWLGVHPRIGQAYMTALASQMAAAGGFDVASDDPRFAVAGCGYPIKQIFGNLVDELDTELQAGDNAETLLGVAGIEMVLPRDLDKVTLPGIEAFRAETVEARRRYREGIASATGGLNTVSDPVALRLHLEARAEQIESEVAALRGQMDEHFGSTVLSSIGVSRDLPDIAAVALGAIGVSTANPLFIAGALAHAVCKTVRTKRAEYRDLTKNPYAYLVAAQDRWNTTGMLDQVRAGARNLVLG
jgi:hypothetical protein